MEPKQCGSKVYTPDHFKTWLSCNHISNFVKMKIALSEGDLSLVTGQFGYLVCCLTLDFIPYLLFFPEKIRIKSFRWKRRKKSYTVFQSYRNHLGEKLSIKQDVLTNITCNAYSEKSTDQPDTNPGSRVNHSRAITMKRTEVTIS